MSASPITSLSEQRLAEAIPSDARVIAAQFSAEWCGPCRILTPIAEEVAQEFGPAMRLVHVDADANPDLSAQFNVRSLPTILLFRDLQLVDRVIGAVRKETLRERIAAVIEGRK